ncbi:MAG: SpoIIE family protein phosphatase [Bacteroidia bacterium]|nr:SpoIIE family protein phosphatase [Bacteroidia bacterium]
MTIFPLESPISDKPSWELLKGRESKKGIIIDFRNKITHNKYKEIRPIKNRVKFNKININNIKTIQVELPGYKENISTVIKYLNKKSGLPTGIIQAVTSDNVGHLWIGTKGFGLMNYDGYNLKIFNSACGFPSDIIQCLYFDHENNCLWIGTTGAGVIFFDGNDFFYSNTDLGLIDNVITSFYKDDSGNMWLSTNDGGVGMFNKYLNQMVVFNSENAFDTDNIRSIVQDNKGNMWFCSAGSGLYRFDSKVMYNYTTENGIPEDIILSCSKNSLGEIWFGSDSKGVFFINAKDSVFSINEKSGLTDNCVTSICEMGGSKMVVGTFDGGINIIDEKKILTPLTKQHGLTSNRIYSLFVPDIKTILACTQDGLNFIYPDWIRIYDENDGINNAYVKSMASVPGRAVYFAAYGNSLLMLRNDSLFKLSSRLITNNNILSVYADEEWNLWFSTEDGNFFCLNNNGILNKYTFNSLDDAYITCITGIKRNLWLGTDGEGVLKVDLEENTVRQYKYKNGLAGNNITHVSTDGKNVFICCDESGISIINNSEILTITSEEHGLPTNNINFIQGSKDGFFLCSEGYGIQIIKENNDKKISLWTSVFGELPTHIKSIYFDERYVILFSSSGLHVYTTNDSSFVWLKDLEIGQHEGINNPEFIKGSVSDDQMNNLYASTSSQILKINKIIYKNKFYPHEPFISGIWYNKISLSVFDDLSQLPADFKIQGEPMNYFSPPKVVSLPYSFLQFAIDVSYKSWFVYPNLITLQYKMNPHEDNWYTSENKHKIYFSKLEPGEYQMSIKVKYSDREFVKDNVLNVNVLPPWWKTIWAQFIFVVLILLTISLIIKLRTRKLIRQKKQLEEIIMDRTREIELQKNLLEEKNKNILDSINYTKRLQMSSLPSEKDVLEIFPQSFILYKPRDIISGDFYFSSLIRTNEGTILKSLVVGDCTGHGVPGAFLSILILAYVKQSLVERDVNSPADALNFVSNKMKKVLEYRADESEVRDSADMAFLVFNPKNGVIQTSCANNPIYIIRKGELIEIEAQKRSVGYSDNEEAFINKEFVVQSGDMIYLFSDGYADQFGYSLYTQGKEKKFTRKRFKMLLKEIAELDVNEQKRVLMEKHLEWKGNSEQTDDVLVVGIRV